MKVPDPKKRNAVARLVAGETTYEAEAQRLGVSVRQLKRWVAAARSVNPELREVRDVPENVPRNVTSPSVTPPGEGRPAGPNPALDEARRAAGGGGDIPPGPGEIRSAQKDMEDFCITAVSQLKVGVGSALVTFRYSPPLSLEERAVQQLLQLGAIAHAGIRANAARLYPVLLKFMSGPYQVFAAIALDGLFMLIGLNSLAQERGWKPKDKPKKEQETRAPGRPAGPVSPATAAALNPNAPDPPPGTCLDAPTIPSEDVEFE